MFSIAYESEDDAQASAAIDFRRRHIRAISGDSPLGYNTKRMYFDIYLLCMLLLPRQHGVMMKYEKKNLIRRDLTERLSCGIHLELQMTCSAV